MAEYDEMMARYLADMENMSRERLAEAADLIAKFTALAASKGVILGAESFEYIRTIGIVAKVSLRTQIEVASGHPDHGR